MNIDPSINDLPRHWIAALKIWNISRSYSRTTNVSNVQQQISKRRISTLVESNHLLNDVNVSDEQLVLNCY